MASSQLEAQRDTGGARRNPRAFPPSSEAPRQLPLAVYALLTKFFNEVAHYPNKTQQRQLLQAVHALGCDWCTMGRIHAYFRRKRHKVEWVRFEGPGVKQTVAPESGPSRVGEDEPAAPAKKLSNIPPTEDRCEHARSRTVSRGPLGSITNLVGREEVKHESPKAFSPATLDVVQERMDRPTILALKAARGDDLVNPAPHTPARIIGQKSRQAEKAEELPSHERDQNPPTPPEPLPLLQSDPRLHGLATSLSHALAGVTRDSPAAPRTFKDLGQWLEQQTVAVEFLESIGSGRYSALGMASGVRQG